MDIFFVSNMITKLRHSALVDELRQRLRQRERARTPAFGNGALSSMGIPALDALLPPGIFRAGMIVEWIGQGAGTGTARLALGMALEALRRPGCCGGAVGDSEEWVAGGSLRTNTLRVGARPGHTQGRRSCEATGEKGGALVVIDERREFYPPAAACLGLDLDRTIVIRPRRREETIWALEQSLRCAGVAVTLAWIDTLSDRVFRRLQLAAEHGAGLGLFLRPAAARREPTWADIRWWVQPLSREAADGRREASSIQADAACRRLGDVLCEAAFPLGRRVQVELLHSRGGTGGGAVTLEISDETGAVSVAPPLAPAATLPRAARA
jgi:hypothetical protein